MSKVAGRPRYIILEHLQLETQNSRDKSAAAFNASKSRNTDSESCKVGYNMGVNLIGCKERDIYRSIIIDSILK